MIRGITRPFILACGFVLLILSAAPAALAADKQVAIRLWDFHVHDKKFRKKAFDDFNKANPDIKVVYTSQISTSYGTVLDAALRTGDPPDIFTPIGVLNRPKLIEMGWIIPIDDVAPSKSALRAWMDTFPQEPPPFLEGVNMFNGKAYSWPSSIQDMSMMLYWNKTLFQEAGLKTPDGGPAVPETLDEVRLFAKKVTELGQGKVYGIVHGIKNPDIWDQDVFFPATGTGWSLFGYDYRTGRYDFKHPGLRAYIQMWLDMKKDGSVFPGDLSMDDEQAKFKFGQGLAGMIFGGYWVPGGLLAIDSQVDFDTVLSPTQRRGERLGGIPGGAGLAGNSEYVISGKITSPDAVWRVIQFMTSAEYQEGWVKSGGGYSVFPEYNKPEFFPHPTMAKIALAGPQGRRLAPVFSVEAQKAWALLEGSQPDLWQTMQGMWIAKLGWEAWDDLENRQNKAVDKMLVDAKKQEINVTRDDFIFPDWDPSKNYAPKEKKP